MRLNRFRSDVTMAASKMLLKDKNMNVYKNSNVTFCCCLASNSTQKSESEANLSGKHDVLSADQFYALVHTLTH